MYDFEPGDRFRILSFSSITHIVNSRIRVKYDDGSFAVFRLVHTPNTDRTPATQFFPGHATQAGNVINAVVNSGTDGIKRGQTYVQLDIQNTAGDLIKEVLIQAYLTFTRDLPLGISESPLEGMGFIRSITGTNPAGGAEITETVPTNAIWRFIGFEAVCAVGTADFSPALVIDDGTTNLVEITMGTLTGAASETVVGAAGFAARDNVRIHFPLPSNVPLLSEGYRIRTSNITADDDWAAPQLWVEEWLQV